MLIKLKKLFSSKTTVLLLLTISSSCMLRTNENQSFNALILSLTNTISVLNSSSTASQPSDVLKEQVLNKGGNFDEYYGALDSSIDIAGQLTEQIAQGPVSNDSLRELLLNEGEDFYEYYRGALNRSIDAADKLTEQIAQRVMSDDEIVRILETVSDPSADLILENDTEVVKNLKRIGSRIILTTQLVFGSIRTGESADDVFLFPDFNGDGQLDHIDPEATSLITDNNGNGISDFFDNLIPDFDFVEPEPRIPIAPGDGRENRDPGIGPDPGTNGPPIVDPDNPIVCPSVCVQSLIMTTQLPKKTAFLKAMAAGAAYYQNLLGVKYPSLERDIANVIDGKKSFASAIIGIINEADRKYTGPYAVGDFNGDEADDIRYLTPDAKWYIVSGREGAPFPNWWNKTINGWPADGRYFVGDFNGDKADDFAYLTPDAKWYIVSGREGAPFPEEVWWNRTINGWPAVN